MSRFRNRMILEDGCARWQRQITGALAVFEKKREQNAGPAITLSGDAQRALPHLAAHRPLPFNPRAREAGWGGSLSRGSGVASSRRRRDYNNLIWARSLARESAKECTLPLRRSIACLVTPGSNATG
jgi:hypothetical protein